MKKFIILFVALISYSNIVAQCPAPTNLNASNISLTSAQISWSYATPVTNFRVEYGDVWGLDWHVIYTTSTNIVLTQLYPATEYYVAIKANCSSGEISDYSSNFTFSTLCNPINVNSFSTVTFGQTPPDVCWELKSGVLPLTGNAVLADTELGWTTSVQSPSNTAMINLYSVNCNYWLISPPINLGTGSSVYQIQVDLSKYFYGTNPLGYLNQSPNARFAVLISTDNGQSWNSNGILQEWNNTTGTSFNTISDNLQTYYIPIINPITLVPYTGNVRFAFYAYENDIDSIYDNVIELDNFNIIPYNGCIRPSNLISSNYTMQGMTLNWTEHGTASQWQIKYGLTGFSPTTSGSTVTSNTNSYTFTNLNQSTMYDFYIRSVCGTSTYSNWSLVHSAATTCPTSSIPFIEPVTLSYMPACWTQTYSGTIAENVWDVGQIGTFPPYSYAFRSVAVPGIGISRLISPPINFENITDPILTFNQICYDMLGVTSLKIQTSSDLINWVDQPYSYTFTTPMFLSVETVPLTVDPGINYIAWVIDGDNQRINWVVKYIMVTSSFPCFPPSSIYVNPNYVTVSWVPAGSELSWVLEYKLASETAWNAIPTSSTVYTFTGLQNFANYVLRIKSVCENNESGYSNTIPFTPTAIEDFSLDYLVEIYPNPTNSEINIKIANPEIQIDECNIFDIYGKFLQKIPIHHETTIFDISSYSSGIYFMKINTDKGIIVKKIVKN
ncbi:MAG: hypothetical protein CVU04_00930 [Bacteroidetes bacterium HGW-Bacteroidetes-20]|nr:MAG: hypothetical protein CVU04_00930 [Bacteroidetes bacterium HGW-Bacteroidetes-20]